MANKKPTKPPKTKSQIMKENRAKVWGKLKEEVADREEVWLDLFTQYSLNMLASAEHPIKREWAFTLVELASDIADRGLELYEARWGEK